MLAFSPLLLLTLASSALASPLSTLPLETRNSVGRLSNEQRRELASRIAVELFAGKETSTELDHDQLERDVALWLTDVQGEQGMEKRLFGFGDSRDDNEAQESYAPVKGNCPTDIEFVRVSTGISDVESAHVNTRLNPAKFISYLESVNLTASALNLGLTSDSSTNSTPNVALAFSGGGYRAMISGGGGLTATDGRASESIDAGTAGIGGIASYITGLSGGSWLVGSYLANNNASIPYLASNLWNLSSNLVVPSDGFFGTISYFSDLVEQVKGKRDEGFATQITDYWGLALGSHLFPYQYTVENTPNLTLSDTSVLSAEDVPYAIIVAAEREPDTLVVAANATIWEFTYNEFGTWGFGGGAGGNESNIAGAFTPTKYLGTTYNNGTPNGTDQCWTGYDNLGFVIGTSSTLFNGAYVQLAGNGSSDDGILESAIESVLAEIGTAKNDVATYVNPFQGFAPDTNPTANWTTLTLVDAGETNQNIPFEPLLIPARGVDAILAFDNSADTTYYYPNGTAPYTTYMRFKDLSDRLGVAPFMPEVPHMNTFVNKGLNTRPTFFGCDARNGSELITTPLIVYVPNYPWSSQSNTSTYKLSYSTEEAQALIANGMRTLTLNNTIDSWSTCLACAFVDRAVARGGGSRADVCQTCLDTWCWDGTHDDSTPASEYAPIVGQPPSFLNVTAKAAATAVASAGSAASTSSSSGLVSVSSTGAMGVLASAVFASMAGIALSI